MGSVRELEERMAEERKKLVDALLDYLKQSGVKAEMGNEPGDNYSGQSNIAPVINLQGQSIDKIRLTGTETGGCWIPGEIFRFQYEINTGKNLSPEEIDNIKTHTEFIKEGKVLSLFLGKITGIKWVGKKLAAALNQDKAIEDNLVRCIKSWSRLEFHIEAAPAGNIYITGPEFTNAGAIAELCRSSKKEEVHCCVFGFEIVENIARHIRNNLT